MTDSLLAPGREVLYKQYHTGELVEIWLSQRSLGQMGLPFLPVLGTRRAPSPGSMFSFSA